MPDLNRQLIKASTGNAIIAETNAVGDNTVTATAGPLAVEEHNTPQSSEWHKPRPHEHGKLLSQNDKTPVANQATSRISRPEWTNARVNHNHDVGRVPHSNHFDTLLPKKPAKVSRVGQPGAAESHSHGNTAAYDFNSYTGRGTRATPPAYNENVFFVNISPGGHATSTPRDMCKKHTFRSGLINSLPITESPPFKKTAEANLNTHLNETVDEVIDTNLQDAIPPNPDCGPTPQQYSQFVQESWPVVSGEKWTEYPAYAKLYEEVRRSALPNFLAARAPIPSELNLDNWRDELRNYHDKTLMEQLEFGFPSNYSVNTIPTPCFTNHRERSEYAVHVKQYIIKECRMGALLGPFTVPPFTPWSHCSPLMTRPKSTPGKRRIIVDLSYPRWRSVNAGIPRREFLGQHQTYTLPTVSMVGDRLRSLGEGCHMWSAS